MISRIILFFLIFRIEQFQFQPIPRSISIATSPEKIYLRLNNNQILIGNRKVLTYAGLPVAETRVVYEFLSIPFAEPPVRERRFLPPIRLVNNFKTEIYDATQARAACEQIPGDEIIMTNEDCLYFNIWLYVTPHQDELLFFNNSRLFSNNLNNLRYIPNGFLFHKTRPISDADRRTTMFWIHGGDFTDGSSNEQVSDGTILAGTENVIVASANYRLGVFGFLYLNNSRITGNMALQDQILAIEWYKEKYLDFFGGLSTNVCLFGGVSGGAEVISDLMLSNKNYLFNRVILQSGEFNESRKTPNEAFANSLNFSRKIGCVPTNYDLTKQPLTQTILNCFLYYNPKFLINKQNNSKWNPTTQFVNENQILNIDVLFGFNQNEENLFLYDDFSGIYFDPNENELINRPGDTTRYDNNFVTKVLKEFFPELPGFFVQCASNLYTYTNNIFLNDEYTGTLDFNLNSPNNAMMNSRSLAWKKISKIASDITYNCQNVDFKNKLRTRGRVYQYNFNKRSSFSNRPRWLQVTHGDEVPYIFGLPFIIANFLPNLDDKERILSANMMSYWANFAKTGNLYVF